MLHTKINNLFLKAVRSVTSDISRHTIHPGKDLTRNRKLPPDKLISFMVSCGSSSTKIELLGFFGLPVHHLPLLLTSSGQSWNRKPLKLFFILPILPSSRGKSRPVTVSLLPTVPPLLFPADRNLHRRSTMSVKVIPQRVFTACT